MCEVLIFHKSLDTLTADALTYFSLLTHFLCFHFKIYFESSIRKLDKLQRMRDQEQDTNKKHQE